MAANRCLGEAKAEEKNELRSKKEEKVSERVFKKFKIFFFFFLD